VIRALYPIVDPIAGSLFSLACIKNYTTCTQRPLAHRIAVNRFLL
jgi:hypothetical protein